MGSSCLLPSKDGVIRQALIVARWLDEVPTPTTKMISQVSGSQNVGWFSARLLLATTRLDWTDCVEHNRGLIDLAIEPVIKLME